MTTTALFASLILLFTACNKKGGADTSTIPEMNQLNIAYGTDSRQKMDLYLPAGRSLDSTRVIILIHGGAWVDGDKADFTQYVNLLRQQFPGYAIFNLNYRLATEGVNLFPTQENDVESAVNFIYDHRDEYQVSGNFVYLGASAGAHLALLQGYKHISVVRPTAIIDLFGPTELKSLYNAAPVASTLLGKLLGGTPTANPGAYEQSSPLFFVNSLSTPTLLLHGGMDAVVPVSQSQTLRDKLIDAGVANDYIFYPNEGHGWTGPNLTDTFQKVADFLRAHP
ncbi:MAG: alpha/beta hydrolase [Chitinophagaceae bacterium]